MLAGAMMISGCGGTGNADKASSSAASEAASSAASEAEEEAATSASSASSEAEEETASSASSEAEEEAASSASSEAEEEAASSASSEAEEEAASSASSEPEEETASSASSEAEEEAASSASSEAEEEAATSASSASSEAEEEAASSAASEAEEEAASSASSEAEEASATYATSETEEEAATSAASEAEEETASSTSSEAEEETASSVSSEAEEEAASSASSEAEEEAASSAASETEEATSASSEAEEETASSASEAELPMDPEMEKLMSLPIVEGDFELSDCVELGDYKGLELTTTSSAVSDEEVEERVRARVKPEEVEDEDAVVEEGDTARIAYVGKKDGVAFDGGSSDSYDLVIGSDTFIDGFEDGIIGMKKGETKDLELTFPENYGSEELAGADVVFTVTLNAILRTPELSDEWAAKQGSGEYKTLEDYLAHQKEVIEASRENVRMQDLQADAWYELQRVSTLKQLPAAYVEEGEGLFEDDVLQEAAAYGMELDDYLTAAGVDKEMYESTKEQYGRYAAQSRLLLEAMTEAEDLTEDSDEYQEEMALLEEMLGMDKEQIFEEHDKNTINQYLFTQIATKRIISYANVTVEGAEQAEETSAGSETEEAAAQSEAEEAAAESEVKEEVSSQSETADASAASETEETSAASETEETSAASETETASSESEAE